MIKYRCILLSLGTCMLATPCVAQDQSARAPIFGSARRLGAGGPNGEQVKEVLKQRIKEQSEGQITLFDFRPIATTVLDLEINDKLAYAVEFEAGIEFAAPCKWTSRYGSRPMTFVIINPQTNQRMLNTQNILEVKAKGERFVVQGNAFFTANSNGWTLVGFGQVGQPIRQSFLPGAASVKCANQLKQFGIVFHHWAKTHQNKFPFNVSTNAGGTAELCVPAADDFDANAAIHFQAISKELVINTPKILVCPADTSRHPAASFQKLQLTNVSYLIRSGPNIDATNSEETLVKCPIHGHVVLCNGAVKHNGSN